VTNQASAHQLQEGNLMIDSNFIQFLAGALPGILGISVLVSIRTRMLAETTIYPNTMVWNQKWRYWAHRYGYIWSPSCGALGIPFSDLKHQKTGVGYGWIICNSCGWESRHRKDVDDQQNPKNWEDYGRHKESHAWPSRPIQTKKLI
jgi:hypothetical protein